MVPLSRLPAVQSSIRLANEAHFRNRFDIRFGPQSTRSAEPEQDSDQAGGSSGASAGSPGSAPSSAAAAAARFSSLTASQISSR
jgi:hypothetical protein